MKRTIEQLRSRVWKTYAEAERDLKANGYPPRGEDYEIACKADGVWFINEFDPALTPTPKATVSILPAKTKPAEVAETPASGGDVAREDRKAAAKVPPPVPPARKGSDPTPVSPDKVTVFPAKAARGARVPPKTDTPTPEPAKTARGNGQAGPVQQPAPAAPVAPVEGADTSPIKAVKGKPFSIVIEGEPVRQGDAEIVAQAVEISRKAGVPVVIYAGGEVRRRIDASKIARPSARAPRAPREPGQPRPGKAAECAKLLQRKDGATKAQLMEVTEWGFGDRYIEMIARTHGCEVKVLGEQHWRLIPIKT